MELEKFFLKGVVRNFVINCKYRSRVVGLCLVDGLKETTLTSDNQCSTSEGARERKTRALREIRFEYPGSHRQPLQSHEGIVMLLGVKVGSRRMRFARRTPACSTILLEKRGLRLPWKTSLPLASHLLDVFFNPLSAR